MDFISAQGRPGAAASWLNGVFERVRGLAPFPNQGGAFPRSEGKRYGRFNTKGTESYTGFLRTQSVSCLCVMGAENSLRRRFPRNRS
jgi:hypothetical protein